MIAVLLVLVLAVYVIMWAFTMMFLDNRPDRLSDVQIFWLSVFWPVTMLLYIGVQLSERWTLR